MSRFFPTSSFLIKLKDLAWNFLISHSQQMLEIRQTDASYIGYIFRLFVVFGCRHLESSESSDRSGILESSGHLSIKISNTTYRYCPLCFQSTSHSQREGAKYIVTPGRCRMSSPFTFQHPHWWRAKIKLCLAMHFGVEVIYVNQTLVFFKVKLSIQLK